ncbi:ArsR family transcriptional regulator [Nitrosopumilus sp.]|uniref:ArsR family transcriptional regulator n=1 Tax=Nitrosopumilus sp. TaxID=2024843 RepID=UPI0034A06134
MPEFNESQCRIITMLRGKNTRKIMIALENDMLTFSLLVEQLKINPSTISINLKKLISFRIVEKNKKNKFTLKTKDITKMINKYKSMTAIFGTVLFYNILQNQNNFMLINLSGFV